MKVCLMSTIAEKILSAHAGKKVHAGDIIVSSVDFMMSQDGTTPLTIKAFQEMNGKEIARPDRYAVVIDHNAPSPMESVSNLHKDMREFAEKHGATLYDVGEGVCHVLVPEQGYALPGTVIIGADSHTCTYGALNAFATGVGSTDLAAALISGKTWFKVPSTIKMQYDGQLPRGAYSKDIALRMCGRLTANGATYKALELCGPVIDSLSVEARMTISNLAVETGAKVGLMDCDQKVLDYLKPRARFAFKGVAADEDAVYEKGAGGGRLPTRPADRLPSGRGQRGPDREGGGEGAGPGVHRHLHQRAHRGPAHRGGHHRKEQAGQGHPADSIAGIAHRDAGSHGVRLHPEAGQGRRHGHRSLLRTLRGHLQRHPQRQRGGAIHGQPQLQGADGQHQGVHLPELARHGGLLGAQGLHRGPEGGAGMKDLFGRSHKFGDNVNTDYIIAGKYKFKSTDMDDMAKHLMEDIRPGFYEEIEDGDFIVAGHNFGMGSSREQAPLVIKAAGISAVVAKDFARIFYRNCINVGLPVIECDTDSIAEGDELRIDLERGFVHNVTQHSKIKATPLPSVMVKILNEGGLAEHFKKHGGFNL